MNPSSKLVVFCLVTVFAIVLGGCAPATSPSPEPSALAPGAPTVQPEATAAPQEVVELRYSRQAEGSDIELQLVEEFNASHPGIHVNVDSVPAEELYNKLLLAHEAGNPPDVYMTWFTPGAATGGLATDLTPFIEKEGKAWFDSYAPSGWLFHVYAGKYYGVPWRVSPTMVVLNTVLLEKAGLQAPVEWTWDDLVTYAKAMTNPADGEYGICIMGSTADSTTDYSFYPFIFEAGGKLIGEDGLSAFNSAAGVEALNFWNDLIYVQKVAAPAVASVDATKCIDMLSTNKVGMTVFPSLLRGIIRAIHSDAQITVAPMPVGKEAGALMGGTGFAMSSITKHPDEAWEFIKFMISDESMRTWSSGFGFAPPNLAILDDPEYLADPENALEADVIKNGKLYPLASYPEAWELQTIFRNYLQAVLLEESTPEDALAAAAAEWDAALKKYQDQDWWAAWK